MPPGAKVIEQAELLQRDQKIRRNAFAESFACGSPGIGDKNAGPCLATDCDCRRETGRSGAQNDDIVLRAHGFGWHSLRKASSPHRRRDR